MPDCARCGHAEKVHKQGYFRRCQSWMCSCLEYRAAPRFDRPHPDDLPDDVVEA